MVTRSPKMKQLLKVKSFKKKCAPHSSHLPFLLSVSRPKMSLGHLIPNSEYQELSLLSTSPVINIAATNLLRCYFSWRN